MFYLLEHKLDLLHSNLENEDAGWIPCMLCETLEEAQGQVEKVVIEKGANYGKPDMLVLWNESTWYDSVRIWTESYLLPSKIWAMWRIVELPLGEFVLGYEREWA